MKTEGTAKASGRGPQGIDSAAFSLNPPGETPHLKPRHRSEMRKGQRSQPDINSFSFWMLSIVWADSCCFSSSKCLIISLMGVRRE